jgi:integrase
LFADIHQFCPEEVLALISAAATRDNRYSVARRVVAAIGMRRGEACALRWSDIDWEAGTLTIDESVIPGEGGAVIKSPKTRASIRRVAIDQGTVLALCQLRAEKVELRASRKPRPVQTPEPDRQRFFDPGNWRLVLD